MERIYRDGLCEMEIWAAEGRSSEQMNNFKGGLGGDEREGKGHDLLYAFFPDRFNYLL